MSRSRKKNGVIKDKGHLSNCYNRMFRRINKQRVKQRKEPKLLNEIVNDYDVCDWISKWSNFDDRKLQTSDFQEYLRLKRAYFNK